MMRLARRCAQAALAALVLAGTIVQAADSIEPIGGDRSLSTWVDGSVGICLEFNNVPQHWREFRDSPLGTRLLEFPPLVAWLQKNREVFTAVRGELERRTGTSPQKLFHGLLGRRVVFAIWPPANSSGDKPSALLLAEAVDHELMRSTLESFIEARKKAGHWRGVRTLEVTGETFTIHAVAPDDEQSEFFLASADDVAMIATSEHLLRSVLQRRADLEPKASLAQSAPYRAARERLKSGAAARVFVNPRAWDLALAADLKRKAPGSEEARSQAAVVESWAATDYLAASLQVAPQFQAELAWKWRPDKLPQPLREVAASLAGRSAFPRDLPSDALMAFALHADVGRLARLAIAQQWQKDSAAHGGNHDQGSVLAWALAAGLGPDFAGYFVAPGKSSGAAPLRRFPLTGAIAVETRPLEPRTAQPALVHQIEPLLHAWLSAAVTAANEGMGAHVASIEAEPSPGSGGPTTVITGIVPGYPKQEIAYRVDDRNRLWAATSAAFLREGSVPGGKRLDDDPLTNLERRSQANPSGFVYVNLAEWRKMAAEGPDAVEFLWRSKRIDERAMDRQYRQLLAIVQLADRLWFTSRVDDSSVHLSLLISADAP